MAQSPNEVERPPRLMIIARGREPRCPSNHIDACCCLLGPVGLWATPLRCPHIHRLWRAAGMIAAPAARPRGHNGATATCGIGRHGADLNRQVRVRRRAHTVPSTHAGGVFHPLRTSSMPGRKASAGNAGAAVPVCPLPRSSARLQLLRSWSDLLCRRLRGGAVSSPARRWPTLPGEPTRPREPRGP
jgi:hypothetical protein